MADENGSNLSGLSFADPTVAVRTRDAIRKIALSTVQAQGSNPNVGRVMSVDIARLKASVWFTGDDSAIEVNLFPGAIPLDLGDYRGTTIVETSAIGTGSLVYVENFRGQPHITRILSGGEYTLNQRVAGLTHQMFNASPLGTRAGAPVGGIYERHVNIRVPADSAFTVGKCMLVGPWAGNNDGSMIDGIVEVVLSFLVSGNVKQCVRKYQFSISDRMVVDLEGDEGNKAFWMRVLPETTLQTEPHAELALDVALVKTAIRAPIEFWLRLVPLDSNADQSEYTMSVKTYGSAFNVGDPVSGRIVSILQSTVEPVQGVLGFHNSGMGFVERDEYASWPSGISWWGDEWSTGPFRAAPLRAANDLRPLWRATSQWLWNGSALSWEGNIIFTGIGSNWNGLHTGSLSVPFPTSSNIPVFPGASMSGNYRAVAGSITLNPGETLYYGLCPGLGAGGSMTWMAAKDHFFIVDSKTYAASSKSFALPEWAIPIATRTYTANGEFHDLIVCNPAVQAALDDETKYCEVVYTSTHAGIIGLDETETMFLPSFRFKKKTAYEFTLRTANWSAVTNTAVTWRLRKGATVAGALISELYRIPMVNTTGAIPVNLRFYIANDTNSDIVTATVVTGQSNGSAATTWTRGGTAVDASIARIDEVGPARKYSDWNLIT